MIEPLFRRHRCLIVGSAPDLRLPPERSSEVVAGANGGAALAAAAGRSVAVLATTAHLCRPGRSAAENSSLDSLRGLSVQSVWLDGHGDEVQNAEQELRKRSVTWLALRVVGPQERAALVSAVTGTPTRVSTGAWLACLAIASDALQVELAGISLRPGHTGTGWSDDAPRDHVVEDRACLAALVRRGVSVPRSLAGVLR